MDSTKEWRFGVAGNIIRTHYDEEGILRYGTKAFSGGTKVYINGLDWNSSWTDVNVIGKNRFGRFEVQRVPLDYIENIRFQRIFQPTVLEIIDYVGAVDGWDWWWRTSADRKEAKAFADFFSKKPH